MLPRWQIFLNEKNKYELNDFVSLIKNLRLEGRVKDIGKDFEVYIYIPTPDGEAFNLEYIRPKEDIYSLIPKYLKDKTIKYFDVEDIQEVLGNKEKDLLPMLLKNNSCLNEYPFILSLMITSDLDVYCNAGEVMPWWSIGNLNTDSVEDIINNYTNNKPLGLNLVYETPISKLAQVCGNNEGENIYNEGDLIRKYIRMYGEKHNQDQL